MSGSQGRLTLSELQSSQYYSGNTSLPTPDFTPPATRSLLGFLRPFRLLRGLLRATWVFAWLALEVRLGSVPLWLGILVAYLALSFSLSRLQGGTRFSLPQTLAVLLLRLLQYARTALVYSSLLFARFILKPVWSFCSRGLPNGISRRLSRDGSRSSQGSEHA